jgi:D-arabinose 5-phosphate isomerase GutQ
VGEDKSGVWSQNLLQAIGYARSMGCRVMSLVGDTGGEIKKQSDACIHINSKSTPVIESAHLAMTHLLVELLKECHPIKVCSCRMMRNPNQDFCKCGEADFEYTIGIAGNIEDWKKLL